MTEETRQRHYRLLAAITDGLTDAPEDVLEQVVPVLEKLAADWSLDEIVERCPKCWRDWSALGCSPGEKPCDCGLTESLAKLTVADVGTLAAALDDCAEVGDDQAVDQLEHACVELDIDTRIAGHVVHILKRDLAGVSRRHVTDTDCRLDDEDCCVGCGVYHGAPCAECGGRGFHAEACAARLLADERRGPVTAGRLITELARFPADAPVCFAHCPHVSLGIDEVAGDDEVRLVANGFSEEKCGC